MPQRKGSAAVPTRTPRSAEPQSTVQRIVREETTDPKLRDVIRRALRPHVSQLRVDAELVELHAFGMAPERAVGILVEMRAAIDRALLAVGRQARPRLR